MTPLIHLLSIVFIAYLASPLNAETAYDLIRQAMADEAKVRSSAAKELDQQRDLSLVPAMVDALFHIPKNNRKELIKLLQKWTGENAGENYYDWVEVIGRRSDIKPRPDYIDWKVSLLSKIDPNYKKILYPGVPMKIRPEEIVWGGVRLGGIPALIKPPVISSRQATYLTDDEKVFGISIGGESRAYPLRILSWHEMTNDVIGGQPITLSY
jgi:hypothetical protein